MNGQRRSALLAMTAVVAGALPVGGRADPAFPEHPLRWVVPFAAGGPSDVVARVIAEAMRDALNGQRPVIENRPGGLTVIGTQVVHTSKPDGYTIGSIGDPFAINELLLSKIPYRIADFEFVRGLITMPIVIAVQPDLPIANLDDLLAYLKQGGSNLSFATWGAGSSAHLVGEQIGEALGVTFTHVPFPGSAPAMNAVLGKHVDFVVLDVATVLPHAQAGKIRIAAVGMLDRQEMLPGVPALSERLPGFDAFAWNGVIAPKGTPPFALDALSRAFDRTLRQPELARNLVSRGMTVWNADSARFKERIEKENRSAAGIIARRGIKVT